MISWIKSQFAKPSFTRTFTFTLIAIGLLSSADAFLAKAERNANQLEAARYFKNGQRLIEEGRSADAAEQFRSAMSLERDNQDYQLALGEAQLASGQLSDAEATLQNLLERNSFSGPANLAMARVLVKQGKINDAIFYYHRAIYGQWDKNAGSNPVRVRMELADLLSRQDSKEGLLAELLPLQDEAADDPATRKKLGWWFLAAGSPARAASVFRSVLHEQSEDAEAYSGLGQAEFAEGNYAVARGDFLAALRLRPDDEDVANRLETSDRVLALNPRRSGLSAEEEYSRSRKLVEAVLDDLTQCAPQSPTGPAQDLIETAEKDLKRRGNAAGNIKLAERLWQMRKASCAGPISPAEEPLALVFGKLAQ
jgi:tetratricopeptide (TPR) repeat protein